MAVCCQICLWKKKKKKARSTWSIQLLLSGWLYHWTVEIWCATQPACGIKLSFAVCLLQCLHCTDEAQRGRSSERPDCSLMCYTVLSSLVCCACTRGSRVTHCNASPSLNSISNSSGCCRRKKKKKKNERENVSVILWNTYHVGSMIICSLIRGCKDFLKHPSWDVAMHMGKLQYFPAAQQSIKLLWHSTDITSNP